MPGEREWILWPYPVWSRAHRRHTMLRAKPRKEPMLSWRWRRVLGHGLPHPPDGLHAMRKGRNYWRYLMERRHAG